MKYLPALLFIFFLHAAQAVSPVAESTANYAERSYSKALVKSLEKMVSFNTVANKDIRFEENPEFAGFKSYLKSLSKKLGLDYTDHGYVVLIGLGASEKKVGVITHGDVQPADASKWQQSPYRLDSKSEPGKLIGRGTEDDKGPIATAMYAMKAIKDKGIKLDRRIELMVYLAEESDWEPLRSFLETYDVADINITIDANYPAVTAEKGWSSIVATVPIVEGATSSGPLLETFSGGSFASQIPLEAKAFVRGANKDLIAAIKARGAQHEGMRYEFADTEDGKNIIATGKSAHSSTPQDGVNAVAFLADALSVYEWPRTTAALTVAYLNDLAGTGIFAEKFGDIAYNDPFMGPMSLAPTVVKDTEKGSNIFINLRRPRGKAADTLEKEAQAALTEWQGKHNIELQDISTSWGDPLVVDDAPHLSTLLGVFSHFTGVKDPKPVAIGGSTNAKLFKNALSFGPSMPGTEYTGHSEHEFITLEQLLLNLKMYTAVFVELGKSP